MVGTIGGDRRQWKFGEHAGEILVARLAQARSIPISVGSWRSSPRGSWPPLRGSRQELQPPCAVASLDRAEPGAPPDQQLELHLRRRTKVVDIGRTCSPRHVIDQSASPRKSFAARHLDRVSVPACTTSPTRAAWKPPRIAMPRRPSAAGDARPRDRRVGIGDSRHGPPAAPPLRAAPGAAVTA